MRKRILTVLLLGLALVASDGLAQGMRATPEQRVQRLKDSLALNDDQAGKVLKIYQDMDQKRSELFNASGGDRQAMMESMRGLNDKADAQIEALLTPAQKVKYAAIRNRGKRCGETGETRRTRRR
jgi:periplasmic protein CpxP/Spy